MRRKVEQMARIERLRRRLSELSTWRLAALAQERDKLAAAHAEMLEALGDGLMAFGPVSVAGTRRVRAIERELAVAAVLEKDLERRALENGRLAKLADQSLASARELWRESLDRRGLEELIEASLASVTASRKP